MIRRVPLFERVVELCLLDFPSLLAGYVLLCELSKVVLALSVPFSAGYNNAALINNSLFLVGQLHKHRHHYRRP